jgi:hypothetical protein
MRLLFAASIVAISLVPPQAVAQERAGDAALGAVSGALVFGPVGAAVGGVIGYTAGPSIARSWGLKRSQPPRPGRSAKRTKSTAPKTTAVTQQRTTQETSAPAPAVPRESPAPRARPSAAGVDARNATPPMQAFE